MTDDIEVETEHIAVDLPDDVSVLAACAIYTRKGARVGAWYVWPPDIGHRDRSPDERWTVGHAASGYAAPWDEDLTFWDALRVARALDDAYPDLDLEDPPTTDQVEAVVGAAMADHYVFPIARWVLP